MKLTTIILARNEEKTIERAIKSVPFSEEVLVVDDRSTDRTSAIAMGAGARVLPLPVNAHFADARNRAESAASGDWILHIDADEVVTPELAASIRNAVDDNSTQLAFAVRRSDFFWGTELKHGETRSARTKGIIRLHKKGVGKWHGMVHETFKPTITIGRLDGYLHHHPHRNVEEFLKSINEYSSIRAEELRNQNKSITFLQMLIYPPVKFIYSYFWNAGFLDGPAGFAYSFFMSFHSFLVRAKVYTRVA